MMAIDITNGNPIWQTPNPHNWTMTHSSIVTMDLDGLVMYVWCTSGGVVGVSAVDGRLLWSYPDWRITIANVPSPLVLDGGRILLTGGYNAGALMLRLTRQGQDVVVEPVYRLKAEVFGAPQHTPIFYQGHIFGVRQDGQMVCLRPDGQVLWTSGPANRFGLGPYSVANGMLVMMNDEGLVTFAKADPAGFFPIGQAKVLLGHESWAPMAFAAGRLIVRDLTRMLCLDLRAQ
jgi:outer membrane protein assembly factor BamB